MTRAKEQALKVYPVSSLTNDTNAPKRKYFIDGYVLAEQDFIEKACEWLKDNIYHRVYECGDRLGFPTAKFIEDFKNYMKGE